jgi:NAD(P)-dependent dehydrogenase (short-subunit alcohol dehydrogenase family)
MANRWTAKDIPDQSGRVVVVTGANSGLGYETSLELARRRAHVILAARNPERGATAMARIREEVPDADVELRLLDTSDLDSVRAFADQVDSPVHVLVNNAGVMMAPRQLTKQGRELHFATNHLGHFALTGLLLPRLEDAAARDGDARVVTVTSTLHRGGRIDLDDLTGERSYKPTTAYAQSKLANVLFGLELDRRLRRNGSRVRSVLAHPGYAATNLQSAGPTGITKRMLEIGNVLMAQSAAKGALPQLYAATAPDVEGGQFIGPNGLGEQRGYPKVVQPAARARDQELARRLWSRSEELTGVTFAGAAA